MRLRRPFAWATLAAALLTFCPAVLGGEVARFRIAEPLGADWTREWIDREVTVDAGDGARAGDLQVELLSGDGSEPAPLPSQFYEAKTGKLLPADRSLKGKAKLRAFFAATLKKNETARFAVTDGRTETSWTPPERSVRGERIAVSNGKYVLTLPPDAPFGSARIAGGGEVPVAFSWPGGVEVKGVKNQWIERGPARSILRRTFRFENPDRRYEITLTFRAGDPWIDVYDEYSLGKGTGLTVDLERLEPDVVYHPYAYNARTFKPGGKTEDSTLEPPQHPIATLGPIWRDIWYGGGPYAFIYRQGGDAGIGFATVRGSEWRAPEGVSLESQNLEVHGAEKTPGEVRVRIPTDGGKRRWAVVLGPPEVRKRMNHLIRARADVPLDTVLDEWILDWKSDAPQHSYGFAWQWFGRFNRHMLNPTTFPRGVRSHLRRLRKDYDEVKSRDLALLAYVFSDPDYWPGPKYKWKLGNPNFNTDMYNVVLQIGLLMPDHPHSDRWVQHGVNELKTNIYKDSYPGGAWAESLSYSGFFFHIVDYAQMLREAGAAHPFRDWPRIKEVANYLACMHTPVDPRYGSRQKAPIGDTHPGDYIEQLRHVGELYRGIDDDFAGKLSHFPEGGPEALDISSREFYGFGAMLRGNTYDRRHESFVTVKAGPARNHFQGDELSFYFASLSTPLAIDYACHYSPRPWHAAMHNRPDMNGKRPVAIACRRAFATSVTADVFVADERTRRMNHVPLVPHETRKPGWEYPWTKTPKDDPWVMRRYAMLVKHDPKTSDLPDYLVVRDEISSPESIWWNLHVLGRKIERDGRAFHFPGQLGVDLTAHVLTPEVSEYQDRQWGWRGNSGKLRNTKGEAYEKQFFGAWVPEDFTPGTWKGGEMAKWLRLRGVAGTSQWLVVLMPRREGEPAPAVEKLSPTSAKVTLGDETEIVQLGTDAERQAAVIRNDKTTELLPAGKVKPLDRVQWKPVPPDIDKGAL